MIRILVAAMIVALSMAGRADAVDRGSPPALLDRARSMIENRGAPARQSEGFALMKRVADEGDGHAAAIAQWNVGNFYLNGIGTEPSLDAAVVYLSKAAAAGVPEAATLLGRIRKP
jgi:TPR repeat protein